MSFQVDFLENKGVVIGKIDDEITLELAIAYLNKASETAAANGAKKLLTDTRNATVQIGDEDTTILSRSLEEMGIAPDLKRAVLIRDDVRFFKLWESLNFKEGRPQMKLFIEEDLAYEWLNK